MRYVCSICGYVYDEAENTPWAELPDDWKCPLCGAAKSDFAPEGAPRPSTEADPAPGVASDMKPLTAAEKKVKAAEDELKRTNDEGRAIVQKDIAVRLEREIKLALAERRIEEADFYLKSLQALVPGYKVDADRLKGKQE